MNKKINIWLPLMISIAMVIGMLVGYRMRDTMPGSKFFSIKKPNTLQEVYDLLNNKYVDKVDYNNLMDTALAAILSKVDPHTVIIPAKELDEINDEIKGSFVGIGIEYSIINDSLNVTQILANGPAFKAGLAIGDILLKSGDSILSGTKINAERIRGILRGPDKSPLKLSVLRNTKLINIEIKRGNVNIPSVDAYYMISDTVGYIKINRFSSQTYKEFMNGLLTLKKQNMKSLILDLRDNGGGVLEEAVEIVDELLEGDKLITYTEGLHSPKKEYRCRRQGQFETGKVVLLANEGTASASEIVLGALQDWDRANIIGKRSFGKGLVQEQYDLSDHSALRLTVARYYTPLGRSIQRSYKNGSKSYYEEVEERTILSDSTKYDNKTVYKTKAGKKLFANGGIRPDIFVESDTLKNNNTLHKIFYSSTISNFGYKYTLSNTTQLSKFKSSAQFANEFNLTQEDWKSLAVFSKSDSIKIDVLSPNEKTQVETYIKATIAKQLFNNKGFVESINKTDNTIKSALNFISK